ncbi:hypothetical protein ACWGNN_00730 [Streptomyces sp. NPDC055817]
MTTQPAAGEVRQLLVHPAVWPHLESWLASRNITVSPMRISDDDVPTFVMSPDLKVPVTSSEQLGVYTQIFKQLPRESAALLVAAVTTDPQLNDRQTAIAQAALLVSVGHRLGWTNDPTL